MYDRNFTMPLSTACAAMAWLAAAALIGTEVAMLLITKEQPAWGRAAGDAGLLCGLVAVTLQVHGFFCVAMRRMKEVFDSGREVERERQRQSASVHSI